MHEQRDDLIRSIEDYRLGGGISLGSHAMLNALRAYLIAERDAAQTDKDCLCVAAARLATLEDAVRRLKEAVWRMGKWCTTDAGRHECVEGQRAALDALFALVPDAPKVEPRFYASGQFVMERKSSSLTVAVATCNITSDSVIVADALNALEGESK